MILRHRLHCIIVKAKCRGLASRQAQDDDDVDSPSGSPAKWEHGHCASEKVQWCWKYPAVQGRMFILECSRTFSLWSHSNAPNVQVVLNEVVIDRGTAPFLTNLEAFCDGTFVTRIQVRHVGKHPRLSPLYHSVCTVL
jgi:hypothetical protein